MLCRQLGLWKFFKCRIGDIEKEMNDLDWTSLIGLFSRNIVKLGWHSPFFLLLARPFQDSILEGEQDRNKARYCEADVKHFC